MGGAVMSVLPGVEMQDSAQQAASASAISGVASKMGVFSGAGTMIFGSMTSEFFIAAIGAVGTIGSLLVNAYYKRKAHELAQRRMEMAHELAQQAEMRRMMEAHVRMDVMRERREVLPTGFDTSPAFLASDQKKEGCDGN